ncbi:hypothetical protein [Streptomyces sp. NPDC087437]|uniref:hypothetical protein n=1 Tax=Streptomyces sp. NPDC087437 TaxID=3365789 RepID=UPI0037F75541
MPTWTWWTWAATAAPWPGSTPTGCPGRSAASAPVPRTASPPRRRAPAPSRPAAADGELGDFLHLYLATRGIPLTPFHNMALMFPDTTEQDVDAHTEIFAAALAAPHG